MIELELVAFVFMLCYAYKTSKNMSIEMGDRPILTDEQGHHQHARDRGRQQKVASRESVQNPSSSKMQSAKGKGGEDAESEWKGKCQNLRRVSTSRETTTAGSWSSCLQQQHAAGGEHAQRPGQGKRLAQD